MKWINLTIVLLLLLPAVSFAQKEKKVEADYTYIVPENLTVEQARRTALDRAKIQAIADEFGTIVSQSNSTYIRNDNSGSSVDFQSLSSSDVKGEWIETIGEPKYEQGFSEDGQMWVRCTVKGRIREIVTAQIDIIAKVLRNGTDMKFEDTDFRDGDDMYLYFKSPVNGFLAVYLMDDASQTAYCLLPYSGSSDAAQKIEHDQAYIFFSSKHAPQEQRSIVDEMTMTCSGDNERNDLFVIFSPNGFAKANSESSESTLPRHLSRKDFNEWLVKARKRDVKMQVSHYVLTMSRAN